MTVPANEPVYEAPFAELLGIRSGLSADGVGSVSMPIEEKHRQKAGVVQGGLIVTLADHALYRAARSTLNPGEATATIEIKVNFLAPARQGTLTATARVLSRGRRVIVGDVQVTDEQQTLIAQALGTYLVLPPFPAGAPGVGD